MRRGFMTVFLRTPICSWRRRRGVLQPSKLAAVGCAEVEMRRGWKRMSLPGSDIQFALACVESGSHQGCRSRAVQRMRPSSDLQFTLAGVESGCHRVCRSRDAQSLPPGFDLQFALAGVESGSHRGCRSREALRVFDDDDGDDNNRIDCL